MPERQNDSIQLSSKEQKLEPLKRRALSRSPHPYHRQRAELPHATLKPHATVPTSPSSLRSAQSTDDDVPDKCYELQPKDLRRARSTESDSGTEADDEHFLKGLPAPKWRPHKGLRGTDGTYSSSPSPLLSPAILSENHNRVTDYLNRDAISVPPTYEDIRIATQKLQKKRRNESGRRFIEVAILIIVGALVLSGHDVALVITKRKKEVLCLLIVTISLVVLYPLRLLLHFALDRPANRRFQVSVLASFDPAPLLYPPTLTFLVASLLSVSNNAILLPAVILSISSLPIELIPKFFDFDSSFPLHWFLSCIPLLVSEHNSVSELSAKATAPSLNREVLILLYPLHRALCVTLHYLTTTSLLRAELQLLSIVLIHLLLLSSSPQAVILKALLWGGGIGTFITCSNVLRWGLTLARVPRWRFRREMKQDVHRLKLDAKTNLKLTSFRKLRAFLNNRDETVGDTSDEENSLNSKFQDYLDLKIDSRNLNGLAREYNGDEGSVSAIEKKPSDGSFFGNATSIQDFVPKISRKRRHTLPNIGQTIARSNKTTPSGRRKRSASSSLHSFFSFTERQATVRKWLYAGYIYICMALIVLLGIRPYVGKYALHGNEPIGWALGYLFGNLPWFRMEVVTANLERWITLPGRDIQGDMDSCHLGWVEHLRHATFGPANVRLILCAYWLAIIVVGLAIVFHLSAVYEVDTRRKVFHFMMVGMLLPATYVDPTFAALALGLMLAIFLILDLFRASQLPPVSKPLAYFLTPYVDGRDLRGPVVISHIFLLIGSAIPLWLSLGTLPRVGTGPWSGWEVPTRDISMTSGVICVGMGDAAASLIGRRYGRHKWFWSGGKSIEGSLAFATAVTIALVAAKAWLYLGGWPTGGHDDAWATTIWKICVSAVLASLTEAVLTGGNDNVVVPVVLWLCVKGLGI